MNIPHLRTKFIDIAQSLSRYADVAHDFNHTLRVLMLAEKIGINEKTDLEIIIPAALIHDVIISPKHNPRARSDSSRSANFARRILLSMEDYPKEKINLVYRSIKECSFSKAFKPSFLESKILQDADRLDAIGAIGIMRACATSGQLQIPFYDPRDSFCKQRPPNPKLYTIDFFLLALAQSRISHEYQNR